MSCYSPLVFQKIGKNPDTGKNIVVFQSHFHGNYEDYRDDKNFVFVPCGQCLGCRLDYAKTWAERCVLESSLHEKNMFLTLTYNNEHRPDKVSKKDFTLFIKRLRHFFNNDKIKYFGCGEYGELSHLPHYHIIIFGVCFDDLKLHSRDKHDPTIAYYTSESLQKIWSYGYSLVGEVNYKTCNYTARYILKKRKGLEKTDEFVLMSTRPGIGYDYFVKNLDKIKENNLIYFNFDENKKTASVNKYFKKLLKDNDFEVADSIIDETINSINKKFKSEKSMRNLDKDLDLFILKKDLKQEKIKRLTRETKL